MRYELVAEENLPDFLDLPWATPLEEWDSARLVDVVRGISRHVVRFVHYDGAIFALKEINPRLARKEYRLLRDLAEHAVPVVRGGRGRLGPARMGSMRSSSRGISTSRCRTAPSSPGTVSRTCGSGSSTRSPSSSSASTSRGSSGATARSRTRCSAATPVPCRRISWTPRQASCIPTLTDGQRRHDLAIAVENLAGELTDVAEAGLLPPGIDPLETAFEVGRRYEALWADLTREELIGPRRAPSHPRAARPPPRARVRHRRARARRRRRRLPAPRQPARRRARLPPEAAPVADRPRRAGEPGPPAARRPPRLPRGDRARGRVHRCPTRSSPTAGSPRRTSQRSQRFPTSCAASSRRPSSTTSCSSTAGSAPRSSGAASRWTRPSQATSPPCSLPPRKSACCPRRPPPSRGRALPRPLLRDPLRFGWPPTCATRNAPGKNRTCASGPGNAVGRGEAGRSSVRNSNRQGSARPMSSHRVPRRWRPLAR